MLASGAATDRDTYGPLLRYVDVVGGTNVGLDLIQDGLAVARYDSRGGCGAHPRLAPYVAGEPAHPTTSSRPASRRSGRPPRSVARSLNLTSIPGDPSRSWGRGRSKDWRQLWMRVAAR
jgi:hypothetical protein